MARQQHKFLLPIEMFSPLSRTHNVGHSMGVFMHLLDSKDEDTLCLVILNSNWGRRWDSTLCNIAFDRAASFPPLSKMPFPLRMANDAIWPQRQPSNLQCDDLRSGRHYSGTTEYQTSFVEQFWKLLQKSSFLEEKILLIGIKIRISKEMTAIIAIETVQSMKKSTNLEDHLNQSIRPWFKNNQDHTQRTCCLLQNQPVCNL